MCVRAKWVVLWSLWAARLVHHHAPAVHVPGQGALRGLLAADGSHYQYFGIPYATSSRQNRFQSPGPAPTWSGVLEAVEEHARCPQAWGPAVVGREDCLALNVYAPTQAHPAAPLPVMVFIHGGGYREGAGSRLLYGPDYLVARNIVLVTFNYRLNILGFLCLGIKEAPGNVGLKDQVAALQWVQRNIRLFGGDPDNVSVFGESAGGSSVSQHLLSPMSRGLFHRAIIQSGSSLAPWSMQNDPIGVATAIAKTLGHNVEDVHQLYNIFKNESLYNLVTAEIPRRDGQMNYLRLPFVPCVEPQLEGVEAFITDTPYNILISGNYNKVPVIIGVNNQEGFYLASLEDNDTLYGMQFEQCLPGNLHIPSPSERETVVQQMKQLYMNDDEVSWSNIVKFTKLLGETFFNFPALVETELLLQTSDQPVYAYLFEHDGWRNFAKLWSGWRFWLAAGAGHADDLFYLFNLFPVPTLFETNMIDTMTSLWTNFAKYGAPGGVGGVQWGAAERGVPTMLRLGGGGGGRARLAPLTDERARHMHFWRSLYHKYRAPAVLSRPHISHT